MQKLFILAFSLCLLVACGKDEDNVSTNDPKNPALIPPDPNTIPGYSDTMTTIIGTRWKQFNDEDMDEILRIWCTKNGSVEANITTFVKNYDGSSDGWTRTVNTGLIDYSHPYITLQFNPDFLAICANSIVTDSNCVFRGKVENGRIEVLSRPGAADFHLIAIDTMHWYRGCL